jgi:hypothetical protein
MSERRTLPLAPDAPFRRLVGVGGIGGGMFLALEGDRTLGRNESRPARLLDVRDYGKLHIVAHHVAVLSAPALGRAATSCRSAKWARTTRSAARGEMPTPAWTHRGSAVADRRRCSASLVPGRSGGSTRPLRPPRDQADVRRCPRPDPRRSHRRSEVGSPRRRLLARDRARAFRVASLVGGGGMRRPTVGLADLLAVNGTRRRPAGSPLDHDRPGPFLDAVAAALGHLGTAVVVTAGSRGAFALEGGTWAERRPPSVDVWSTAGAGDALLGGVLAALAAGVPLTVPGPPEGALSSALDFGVALAAFSVTSRHTIPPDANLEAVLTLVREAGLSLRAPLSNVV